MNDFSSKKYLLYVCLAGEASLKSLGLFASTLEVFP